MDNFKPYMQNQAVLFPSRIDEDIEESDPARLVDRLVERLDLRGLYRLYSQDGCPAFHPKMMLKVLLYAYMSNIYSCRKIEKALKRDIAFMWLAGCAKPDFVTINRFRNRAKEEIDKIFTQTVVLLVSEGYVSLDVEYIDGTKVESKANRYTFVWRKTVERNRERLLEKIRALLEQIDTQMAQDNAADKEEVEITPEALARLSAKLAEALAEEPAPQTPEEKESRKGAKRALSQLDKHAQKLEEYDQRLETMGTRNSYSKTDTDATFMRLKEDHMQNGQTKPAYNLQIGTANQFITHFGLFPNPNDTATLAPFLTSFHCRYGRYPAAAVADSGYGSEENYSFMDSRGITPYVKYNSFNAESKAGYKPSMFSPESLQYNAGQDCFVCPQGQRMGCVRARRQTTASGYVIEHKTYQAQDCSGCPLREQCFQGDLPQRAMEVSIPLMRHRKRARELLTSEAGIMHMAKRSIEPEAVFGQMKQDMAYRRFRHIGKDKVTMDFAFFAIAFNLKKMRSIKEKSAKNSEKLA